MRRLYFDNAATSFPKPPGVYEAMLRYGQRVGGTAGRGSYHEALEGARVIRECRERVNTLINGEDPDHVVFTLNTTDALNLAIKGVVAGQGRRPVHLITTVMDHNSVLRPFNRLAEEGVEWTCVGVDERGLVDPEEIRRALRAETALVAVVHASNVTGVVQPAAEIGAVCRGAGVPFLLDAAQSLGHIPLDVRALNVDLLAMPGHKGLLGPLGTGALYLRPGMERILRPLREGGTGSRSEVERQPEEMPDKYEPGSQNAVGIAGLSEAVKWILERGEEHFAHEARLRAVMMECVEEMDGLGEGFGELGLRLLGSTEKPAEPGISVARVGVYSFVHEVLSAQELAVLLEQRGVLVRAGLHCAPRAHGVLGTRQSGGAMRMSLGAFLTEEDVRAACGALGEVCRAAVGHRA